VAPDINRFLLELGPFSEAGIPAIDSLGEASKIGKPAIEDATPVIRDLRTLASSAKPVAKTLADVLVSFQRNDGIERLMDYLFFQAAAVNGFDSFGHYLRAGLIVNQCSNYATEPTTGCSANFRQASASRQTAAASSMPRDPILAWTARVLQGLSPKEPPKRKQGGKRTKRTERPAAKRRKRGGKRPAGDAPAQNPPPGAAAPTPTPAPSAPAPVATPAPPPAAPAPTATPTPESDDDAAVDPLLDYLFGGGD
jgi:phospholipid/cholesterol/gamma-HCH transport system substrate-binding protein